MQTIKDSDQKNLINSHTSVFKEEEEEEEDQQVVEEYQKIMFLITCFNQ